MVCPQALYLGPHTKEQTQLPDSIYALPQEAATTLSIGIYADNTHFLTSVCTWPYADGWGHKVHVKLSGPERTPSLTGKTGTAWTHSPPPGHWPNT